MKKVVSRAEEEDATSRSQRSWLSGDRSTIVRPHHAVLRELHWLPSSPSENQVQAGDDSLQVPTRTSADVPGGRMSGKLCHCQQSTPAVRWQRITVSTKGKNHVRDEKFCIRGSSHLEQFTSRPAYHNSVPLTFARHLKAHLFA